MIGLQNYDANLVRLASHSLHQNETYPNLERGSDFFFVFLLEYGMASNPLKNGLELLVSQDQQENEAMTLL
jgi:hypothetical protein